MWGGLLPIPSQLALDSFALCGLLLATCSRHDGTYKYKNLLILLTPYVVTLATSGPTNRWTLTLPMAPLLLVQGLRRIPKVSSSLWLSRLILAVSLLLIALGAALSILFPAVQLPTVKGPYHVGVVDFYLPVDLSSSSSLGQNNHETCTNGTGTSSANESLLSVRLLYPTLEQPTQKRLPYLKPQTSREFCRQSMKFGAPPPLKEFGWMLHQWRLTGLNVKQNATLLPPPSSNNTSTFPLVVYSHGLGGTADIYSFQTMSLAAHGTIVLAVNHLDGSAPVVQKANGELVVFDMNVIQLWREGKKDEYVQVRRARTNHRVTELVAATEALLKLSEEGQPHHHIDSLNSILGDGRLNLTGRLDPSHVSVMGHSFGGATVLTAAKRRPTLFRSVIAHEPAVDWMPDDARLSLLERGQGANHDSSCMGPNETSSENDDDDDNDNDNTRSSSIHDTDILMIFSHEWRQKNWGCSHIFDDMHRRGQLGRTTSNNSNDINNKSAYHVIDRAHHTEFSDTSMITPLWLARSTGVTGSRNPIHTAREIAERTRDFLNVVHG